MSLLNNQVNRLRNNFVAIANRSNVSETRWDTRANRTLTEGVGYDFWYDVLQHPTVGRHARILVDFDQPHL